MGVCVESAALQFSGGAFFYQHFAIYGPGDWAAASGGLMRGGTFFRQAAREDSD